MATVSGFAQFMKEKQRPTDSVKKYAVTKAFTDDEGKPLEWEFSPVSSRTADDIQNECIKEVPVPGKPNMFRPRLDMVRYNAKIAAASIVMPDLRDVALQNSYGVSTPEDLLYEMVKDAAEYSALIQFTQELNSGESSFEEKVDSAKN